MKRPLRQRRSATVRGALIQLLPTAALFAFFAAVGIVHVTSRVMVVHVGYSLSELEQEATQLVREYERLKLELATLKNPARLERIAQEQLSMGSPPAGAVIQLKAPAKVAYPAPSAAGQKPNRVALVSRSLPR
jgi:cell division protein FtsL